MDEWDVYIRINKSAMYQKWLKNPVRFVAMTGYSMEQFSRLLPYFDKAHQQYFSRHDLKGNKKKELRRFVIYSNSPLPTVADRLAFILSFKKLNPIQEQQADWFNMTQKQCNEFIHSLTIVLENALRDACVLPAATVQQLAGHLDEAGDTMTLLHDGTEREIPRPVDAEKQQEHYSGKKKKHTLKNAVIVTATCLIVFVGATVNGAMHDKKLAEQQYLRGLSHAKAAISLWQHTGYQGFAPQGVTIIQPQKKPKGKELTVAQKERNRQIAAVRIRVEHAIGSTKRYRIVKDECRLRKNQYPYKVFALCAALHNFRLEAKPFIYPEIKLT
jgi:DDE superfamily endonuclease